jgi:hypothetical protein
MPDDAGFPLPESHWIPERIKIFIAEEIAKAKTEIRKEVMTVLDDAVTAVNDAATAVSTAADAVIAEVNNSADSTAATTLQGIATTLTDVSTKLNDAVNPPAPASSGAGTGTVPPVVVPGAPVNADGSPAAVVTEPGQTPPA